MISDCLELLASEALMLVTLLFTTHLSTDICIFTVDGKKKERLYLSTTKSSFSYLVSAKEHLL